MPTLNELETIKREIDETKNTIENLGKELRKGIVAGIDLSLSSPGITIANIAQDKIVYRDVFPKKGDKQLWERLMEIELWLKSILNTFRPEIIMVEDVFMSKFTAKSNMPLLKAHGYIIPMLQKTGASVRMILPSSARAYLKIKPNNKETAFNWISERFPELHLTNFKKENDIADSVVIVLNATNEKATKL
jgi:Holliday junction resolvasome RuvABC endonuclease subunit